MGLSLKDKWYSNYFSKSLSIHDVRHNHNVHILARDFTNYKKLPTKVQSNILIAALYHDIGKAFIPESILNKKGPLKNTELRTVQNHSAYSYKIMKNIGIEDDICNLVLHHHELYDGTGYPDGLKGENIPLGSRILCIIDNYDALTSLRPYKKALSKKDVLNIMKNESYKFDPLLFKDFLAFISSSKY